MSDMEKVEGKEMTEVKIEEPKAEESKDGNDAAKDEKAKPAPKKAPKERKPYEPPCDIINRDPTNMNEHVKVTFHDVFAEPDSTIFSFDRVWGLSYTVFTGTKLWCYRITSLLCAIPLSVVFGIWFACLSFCNIWLWMPCLKGMGIKLLCTRRIFSAMLESFVAPCYEAMGKIFSSIRVTLKNN